MKCIHIFLCYFYQNHTYMISIFYILVNRYIPIFHSCFSRKFIVNMHNKKTPKINNLLLISGSLNSYLYSYSFLLFSSSSSRIFFSMIAIVWVNRYTRSVKCETIAVKDNKMTSTNKASNTNTILTGLATPTKFMIPSIICGKQSTTSSANAAKSQVNVYFKFNFFFFNIFIITTKKIKSTIPKNILNVKFIFSSIPNFQECLFLFSTLHFLDFYPLQKNTLLSI